MANLTEANVTELEIVTNTFNLRKDLHIFVEYMQQREVKRAYRTNFLPKTDSKRLAKLMSDPNALGQIKRDGYGSWLEFVDDIALKLGFVSYDTEGSYAGYSSSEPTFSDNYIYVKDQKYEDFLDSSLAKQEAMLVMAMIEDYKYDNNELLKHSILGQLDTFPGWGCATGVLPTLNFASARRILFDVLSKYPSGIWYSTASLVAYLKREIPFFLIPKRHKTNRPGKSTRYGNFREQKTRWDHGKAIPDDAPDGFERVEGRYVERFLESIPLILGYVDVAYSKEQVQTHYPAMNRLQAFRINEHFLQVMHERIPEPKVTVQPNFEIQVDSVFYPINVIRKLLPLTKLISDETVITLKLEKKKVAQQLIDDENLNVIALLTELSDRRLPQNIIIELKEWAGHSEKITLYDGFGILEANQKVIKAARQFIVEDIAQNIKLVRLPDKLNRALQEAELIPLQISHLDSDFEPLPEQAKTVFITKTELAEEPEPEHVILKLERLISLHFPTVDIFDRFCKEMAHVHCPGKLDRVTQTITYSIDHTTLVDTILKRLEENYKIEVKES